MQRNPVTGDYVWEAKIFEKCYKECAENYVNMYGQQLKLVESSEDETSRVCFSNVSKVTIPPSTFDPSIKVDDCRKKSKELLFQECFSVPNLPNDLPVAFSCPELDDSDLCRILCIYENGEENQDPDVADHVFFALCLIFNFFFNLISLGFLRSTKNINTKFYFFYQFTFLRHLNSIKKHQHPGIPKKGKCNLVALWKQPKM